VSPPLHNALKVAGVPAQKELERSIRDEWRRSGAGLVLEIKVGECQHSWVSGAGTTGCLLASTIMTMKPRSDHAAKDTGKSRKRSQTYNPNIWPRGSWLRFLARNAGTALFSAGGVPRQIEASLTMRTVRRLLAGRRAKTIKSRGQIMTL